MPTQRPEDRYEIDPRDGLVRGIVGDWVDEKHKRLRHYVDISRAARRKFQGNSTYIDLYSGSGRARVRDSDRLVDGSAIAAVSEAGKSAPFGHVHIADFDAANVSACASRMREITSPPVTTYVGKAEDTVRGVVSRLSPSGLHLAFLDPFNIESLPFSVIQSLAQFEHMDLIIHVSAMDLQRNVKALMASDKLSAFAPSWQSAINPNVRNSIAVVEVMRYWRSLIAGQGLTVSHHVEKVAGARNQPLYWLVLAGKHPLADAFWGQVSNVTSQGRLPF